MIDLQKLKEILEKERELAVTDIAKKVFRAKVVESDVISILECKNANYFNSGDVVGVFEEGDVKGFGTVLDSKDKILTVYTHQQFDGEVQILDYEPLIALDLQIDFIERINKRDLNELEEICVNVFIEKNYKELRKIKIEKNSSGIKLDSSQIDAIEHALALEDGEILLITGPPGTGKTTVIAEIAKELSDDERIMIASHTNRAVDNAIEKLPLKDTLRVGRPEKVSSEVKEYLLSYKARKELGNQIEDIEAEIENYLRSGDKRKLLEVSHLLEKRNEMLRKASEDVLLNSKVVGTTLVKSNLFPLKNFDFDTVIIDECNQASITLALLGMKKGRKYVLVGDDMQLPPIFRVIKNCEQLSAFGFFLKKYPDRMKMLKIHRRSHPEIIGFSAKYLYNGEVVAEEGCLNQKLKIETKNPILDPEKPLVFVHVDGEEGKEGLSKFNKKEIEVCRELADEMNDHGVDFSVITPYIQQKKKIEKLNIPADTIDAFQGREKDAIIFSVTATKNLEFAAEPRRLNVAITRARKKLVVLSNAHAILKNRRNLLYKFFMYAHKLRRVYDWENKRWM